MKHTIALRKTQYLITLVLSVLLLLGSCTVKLVPDHDEAMVKDITETAKKVDRLYLEIKEIPEAEARTYEQFSQRYVDIEVELNSLLLRNKAKPLNKHSTRINEIIIELFKKYKTKHQTQNKLSDIEIELDKTYLLDAFNAMLVAEEGKKYGQGTNTTEE